MMTSEDFLGLEQNFNPSSEEQRLALEKITYRYPYFQAAYALYLKTLQKQNIYNFDLTLRKTAILTPDRNTLYCWLYDIEEINQYSGLVSNKEKAKNEIIDPGSNNSKKAPISSHVGSLSFLEWIELIKDNSKEASPESTSNKTNEEGKDLIDTFIESNPKMPPVSTEVPKQDLSKETYFDKNELMTETLARVYVKQRKFKKALIAYKILSLKYPEKNGFFADQIKAIKQLIQK